MKKTLLFLLFALASAPAAFAQGGTLTSKAYASGGTDARNTGFGVKGGYNLSNFYGSGKDFLISRDNINTFHAGFFGQFGLNEFSSVQVELLYSRKGARANLSQAGLSDLRLDYLSVPVLYVGNLTNNLSFHIGPEISLLTKVNSDGKNLDLKGSGFNTVDYGGVIGAEYRLGPARLGVRYDVGLGRILKDGSAYPATVSTRALSDTSLHNQTFQAYVGFGITQ